MKKLVIVFLLFNFLFFNFDIFLQINAKECNEGDPKLDEICRQLNEVNDEYQQLTAALGGAKKSLSELENQIKGINTAIAKIRQQIKIKEKETFDAEVELEFQKRLLFARVRSLYIQQRKVSPFLVFLATENLGGTIKKISYTRAVGQQDKEIIIGVGQKLVKLENDQKSLETKTKELAGLEEKLDQQAASLKRDIKSAQDYQEVLSKKIADLTAEQEKILAEKAGLFQTSVGDTPPVDDPCAGAPGSSNFCSPGFSPAFGVFSFGAPHRTGMSQYGAFGRSKTGQSAEEILAVYYQGATLNKNYPVPETIGVNGYGRIPFEENYLLGIYEMPEKWGDEGGFEALKAQAVAARSYALAVTNNGNGSICPTESCQVYKPNLKSGKWAEAVRATRGWVLLKDAQPAKTYYASTAGGFTVSQWGWSGIKDAKDGDWPNQAYEKIAGSPWFYKAWYKSRSGESCGRSHPWLTDRQMADILNAWHLLYQGGGEASRVSPTDTDCWSGNPYSIDELASIGGYNSVSSVSVSYSNNGNTASLVFETNKGSITINGEEFKKAFNLRAPGMVSLKSNLFNIVKI